MRRRRAILIAEDPDKTEKHHESRITLPIRRKKSAIKRKHKIKCAAKQKNTTKNATNVILMFLDAFSGLNQPSLLFKIR